MPNLLGLYYGSFLNNFLQCEPFKDGFVISALGRKRQTDPHGSLVSLSSQLGKSQISERSCLKKWRTIPSKYSR